ncbi:uncharacterized protein LOC115724711 [Cannabis sativa]|uniref:uncharacterized protein LOC115724711 n=1 Tax=Cannabis sativa TaxID=3483 RepID=UPI0029CA9AB4|nr:uncharacterized protein LOC115724711 [Cannabis sativa]
MGNSHSHHLVLLQQVTNEKFCCDICDEDIFEPSFYKCNSCDYSVHKKCYQINHHFHPPHPLKLSTTKNFFICNSCHKQHNNQPYFTCEKCNFYMDVKCVKMPPILSNDDHDFENSDHHGRIKQHFTHQHPMPLISIRGENPRIKCIACSRTCSNEAYGCKYCVCFLHKTCANLPEQIQGHFSYPNHTLYFHISSHRCSKCKLCENSSIIFSFKCRQCNIHFCVSCVVAMFKPINFKYHEHSLYFVERIHGTNFDYCDGYDSYCKNSVLKKKPEFNRNTKLCGFCCVDCGFKVHLQCGILPSIVQYKYHTHPLVLVDWAIDNDGCYECYCDICETERDPRFCAYICEDCKYVAHVQCLASEIINVLKGDLRDVKLKIVGDDAWKFSGEIQNQLVEIRKKEDSIFTFQDLIHTLTELEEECFKNHFFWLKVRNKNLTNKMQSIETTPLVLNDENIDELLQISSFTENEYISFIYHEFKSFFREKNHLDIKSSDLLLKIVDVEGNYSIPLNFVCVMKHILHNYGDIGHNSTSSSSLKSICFFLICRVMKKMYATLVIDISKDLLREWYCYIRFAKVYGNFDVGFIEESFKAVTRDFFFIQVSKLLDHEIPNVINNNMGKLQEKLNGVYGELQNKMEEYESKLEMRKRFCETTSEKKLMKRKIDNVIKLKWKTASQVGF